MTSNDSLSISDLLPKKGLDDLREQAQKKLRQADEHEKKGKMLRSQGERILVSVEKIEAEFLKLAQFETKEAPTEKISKRAGYGTWTGEISAIIAENPNGISYAAIKSILSDGPLAEKLRNTDKGFYSALLKLEKRGEIVRHNSHAFTPQGFEKYQNEVKMGKRDSVHQDASIRSPLTRSIFAAMEAAETPITGKEIIDAIVDLPGVGEAIRRNHTGVYNVLTRLIRQGRVIKNDKDRTYRLTVTDEEPKKNGSAFMADPLTSEVGASLNGSKTPNGAML